MNCELTSQQYEAKAWLRYEVTDAPAREVPYTRTGAQYVPQWVTIVFSAGSGNSQSSLDLTVYDVTLHGLKLRKDKSIGLAECTEKLYNYEKNRPEWVLRLIEQAKRDLS